MANINILLVCSLALLTSYGSAQICQTGETYRCLDEYVYVCATLNEQGFWTNCKALEANFVCVPGNGSSINACRAATTVVPPPTTPAFNCTASGVGRFPTGPRPAAPAPPPTPAQCNAYTICEYNGVQNVAYSAQCSSDLEFNSITKTCMPARSADCSIRTCINGTRSVVSTSCKSYDECINGAVTRWSCGPYFFNSDTSRCVVDSTVCGTRPVTLISPLNSADIPISADVPYYFRK